MSYTLWDSVGGHRAMVLAVFTALLLCGACTKNNLIQGRCNRSSDCGTGLVCDDMETCVPSTASSSPCSHSAQCGSDYSCDNLGWCVCANKGATGGNVCANGSSVVYRGVETDGGMPDGAGGASGTGGSGGAAGQGDGSTNSGGSGGSVCHANTDCPKGKGVCADGGVCVQCTADTECTSPTSPICDTTTNTCVPCTTDAQCVSKFAGTAIANPGVCMFQTDGHCATDLETVYIKKQTNPTDCPTGSTPGAGTATLPFCTIGLAAAAASTRSLLVLQGPGIQNDSISNSAPLSIVGQSGATIVPTNPGPGLHIAGTDVYIRSLQILGSMGTDVGIVVDGGGFLRLDMVTVDGMSQGGIFIDSTAAGFDIQNTTVTNNGPGKQGTTTWGGILVSLAPDGGTSSLNRVTVESNKWTGIICAGPVSSSAVFASSNTSGDIVPACGIVSCMTAGPTCGAPQ